MSRSHPDILQKIRVFTESAAGQFFRDFFKLTLDLLIISDCTNRYILICSPELKDRLLNKKTVSIILWEIEHHFRSISLSTRQLQNANPASLKIHCMRQRAYAKSNPVLTCSGWPSDSTRFIRKKNSVTKGRKEGRNLRGYGCHISVTAGRLVIKGSKKSQN